MKRIYLILSVLILVLAMVGTANSEDRKDRNLKKSPGIKSNSQGSNPRAPFGNSILSGKSFSNNTTERSNNSTERSRPLSEVRTPQSNVFSNSRRNSGGNLPNYGRPGNSTGTTAPERKNSGITFPNFPRQREAAPQSREFKNPPESGSTIPRSSTSSNPISRQYRRSNNDSSGTNTKRSLRDWWNKPTSPSIQNSDRPTTDKSGKVDRQNSNDFNRQRRSKTDQNSALYPDFPRNTDRHSESTSPTERGRNPRISGSDLRTRRNSDQPTRHDNIFTKNGNSVKVTDRLSARSKSSSELKSGISRWNNARMDNSRRVKTPEHAEEFNRNSSLHRHYNRVVSTMGFVPHNRFYFTPRRSFHPRIFDCYYPYYIVRISTGGCFFSVFHNWGWCPTWVEPARVVIIEDIINNPDSYERLDTFGANQAINDLKDAWVESDISPIDKHLSSDKISIYFDDKYSYSIESNDFYAMLSDQFTTIETISLTFNPIVWVSPCEVFVSGYQRYEDPDGDEATLHISFRLRKIGDNWNIVSFGSSKDPIECPYQDFRK